MLRPVDHLDAPEIASFPEGIWSDHLQGAGEPVE